MKNEITRKRKEARWL